MNKKIFRRIALSTAALWSCFLALPSVAAGTAAGTTISNTASVTYSTSGGQTATSVTNTQIKVQEVINVSVVNQNAANVSVSSPDTDVPLAFDITNTGNGPEQFTVTQTNITGDNFDATLDFIYLDDGDGVFEPNSDDILYNNNSATLLQPDQKISIWATSDIPSNLTDSFYAEIQLTVLSKTFADANNFNPQAGDVLAGQGESSTDAVAGTSQAREIETARYLVTAIDVNITKSVTEVRDNLGQNGNQAVPGAEVDYVITVTVTGSGTATGVVVADPLPNELRLKDESNGIIVVNSVNMGAAEKASDGDDATYDANTNTVTVDLGDITAGDPAAEIKITTIIQ